MIAVATMGVGYGLWFKILTVNGTVATGTVNASWFDCVLTDTTLGPPYLTPPFDQTVEDGFVSPPTNLDKNVAKGGCTGIGTDTLTLTLTNTYPSYYISANVYPQNTGSVPVVIDEVDINGTIASGATTYVSMDLGGDANDDFELLWQDNLCVQLDPGDPAPEISFRMHLLQEAPQTQTGTLQFTITLKLVQWNEKTCT